MRQLAIMCCLVGAFVLWGCGGHKKTPPTPPAKVTFDVPGISLTFGEILTIQAASVHVVDASGNVLTNGPTFTVSSANTNLVTINSANNSEICGGIFNANVTLCSPKDANGNFLTAGSTTITISAQGVNSDPIPVSVHQKVTSAIVVSPSNSCVSQNQPSAPYTVVACSAGTAPACTGGTNIANTLGTITWSTTDSSIATVDSGGVVTSKLPGAVNVNATLGNVNPVNPTPALFVSCPPKTISIHVTGDPNAFIFSLDPGASTPVTSVKLDADITDTAGQPITGAPLTWSSFTPASATVGTDGTVTAVAAGTTSIVASCTPPTCNNAPALSPIPAGTASPVFSNLVTGSVAGTSAPTVYATAPTIDGTPAGAANMTLLAIDPANPGTLTTTIPPLPHPANSMVFDRTGSKAYLGTADGHGLMIFDPNNPTATITPVGDGTITGSVVAVSRDGTRVVISDTTNNKVFVYNTAATSNNIETYTLSGITGADFALNSSNGFFASPAAGQFYVPGRTFPLSPLGTDVKYLPQGSVAYFSGDPSVTTKPFTGVSTCNNATIETGNNAANVWGVATDGSHLVGANATGWLDLKPNVPAGPCPAAPFNSNAKAVPFSSPSFVGTPTQVVVTPDSKKVFMTGFTRPSSATTSGIPFYDIAAGTANVVTTGVPADGQVFSGGITLDGNALYIGVGGASAPGIYKVDPNALTATPLAVPATSLTFVPSIVTVRPK